MMVPFVLMKQWRILMDGPAGLKAREQVVMHEEKA
jgi:hypothetical protein